MQKHVNGSVSRDFPLFHSKLIPIYIHNEKHSQKPQKNKFVLTNEHPDFFRLDGMKEEGYKNPFLKDIIKVDRDECYKSIDYARRHVNFINFINSNRKYSQDKNVIKYIMNATTKNIKDKRQQIIKDKLKIKKINSSEEHKIKNIRQILIREKILKELKKNIPKIDYKMSSTIDHSKPVQTEYDALNKKDNHSSFKSIDNERRIKDNLLKKYNFFFDTKRTSYLKNVNDYNISEAQKRDLRKRLNYQRKPFLRYNLIRGQYDVIKPPPYVGDSWDSFHENFYTIEHNANQFKQKGGLFTEFTDKNRYVIAINKKELREKIEKERGLKNTTK